MSDGATTDHTVRPEGRARRGAAAGRSRENLARASGPRRKSLTPCVSTASLLRLYRASFRDEYGEELVQDLCP